jgi:hypothetical protein
MNTFTFIDSSNEKYSISFGWKERNSCTICLYPQKFDSKSLAMCTFEFTNKLLIDGHEWWADEFISLEAECYINKLIKNKLYW